MRMRQAGAARDAVEGEVGRAGLWRDGSGERPLEGPSKYHDDEDGQAEHFTSWESYIRNHERYAIASEAALVVTVVEPRAPPHVQL